MKKVILIVVPLLLIVGGTFFAASKGMINIPGITPKKAPMANYGEPKDPQASQPVESTPEPEPSTSETDTAAEGQLAAPESDPAAGVSKVATIWNEMEVSALLVIIADWTNEDLVPILNSMDTEKVTSLLQALASSDPKRASSITKALQKEASKLKKGE